jgi:glycosyltransferase involved in cell wall biosynthesis
MMFLFDLVLSQPNKSNAFHGGGEYGYSVLKHLINSFNYLDELIVIYNKEVGLSKELINELEKNEIKTIHAKSPIEVLNIVNKLEPLFFFAPLSDFSYYHIKNEIFFCSTIHDTRFNTIAPRMFSDRYALTFLESRSLKVVLYFNVLIRLKLIRSYVINKLIVKSNDNFNKLLNRINVVFTVSEYSYTSIFYHMGSENIKKVQVYYTPDKIAPESNQSSKIIEKPYVLMVGANRYIKNVKIVIEVIDDLITRNLFNHHVVVTGGYPTKLSNKLLNKDYFIFFDYVASEKLENFYEFADLFIFPSLSEGFGLPPLEALKYGTKVLASYITAIPEVCGDSIFYFNPIDEESIAINIIQSLSNPNKRLDHYNMTKRRQLLDIMKLMDFFNEKYSEIRRNV